MVIKRFYLSSNGRFAVATGEPLAIRNSRSLRPRRMKEIELASPDDSFWNLEAVRPEYAPIATTGYLKRGSR